MSDIFDFEDGNGSVGGWVADTATVDDAAYQVIYIALLRVVM